MCRSKYGVIARVNSYWDAMVRARDLTRDASDAALRAFADRNFPKFYFANLAAFPKPKKPRSSWQGGTSVSRCSRVRAGAEAPQVGTALSLPGVFP